MLAAWLVLLAVVIGLVKSVGANTSNNLELPGTDSQDATDLLAKRFPPQQNGKNPIVFFSPDDNGKVTDADNKRAIQDAVANVKQLPHAYSVTSPFSQQGQAQISKDGQTAFLTVLLDIGNEEVTEGLSKRYLKAAEGPARAAGMKAAASGQIGSELSEPETHSSDLIGLFAAMLILTFTFGTLVAMGMAIVPAVLGLLIGLSVIGLLGHVTEVPSIAPTLGTMIGLGVGIDYALFLVSRYRSHRAEGLEKEEAIATAVGTTGTAIVFAGGTVVIALVSLMVAGIPLVSSLGYASAFSVLTAVLAAITLLPALLSLVGRHIDSIALPAFLHPKPKPEGKGFWNRWAAFVTGHPGRAILLTLALLFVLIIPFSQLDLGQEDIGATPKDTTERKAYDYLAAGFGAGYTGPLLVAVNLGDEPAKPSEQFEKQYAKAQSLQAELEEEQAQGETQAESLENSADELEAQGDVLLAEKDALETKAGDLKTEKGRLKNNAAKLQEQRDILEQLEPLVDDALSLVKQGAQLAQSAATLVTKLERVRAAEQVATDPTRKAALQAREAELEAQLNDIKLEQGELNREAKSIGNQIDKLKAQATKLGKGAFNIAADAAQAAVEAITLVKQKNKLVQQAANLKVKAANLNTQKAQLEALQEQAETQQQQAEKLKQTLTDELTLAGGDERGTDTRLVNLQEAMTDAIGVQVVSPPAINKEGNAAVYTVVPDSDPADERTTELVQTIRNYIVPQETEGYDMKAHVGGSTAGNLDLATEITDTLFLVIFVVCALGFTVLLMAFRSFLVSTQAVIAILLSVCAAFGVLTACFQLGWGIDLVGIDTAQDSVPIASFVPLIMFAVLFGLSMDYQVFLMSQVEHARTETKDPRLAVRNGLAAGARVISAAALIMMSVFGSFIINGDPTVKQFGVGLSVGVALACLCVLTLTPAILTMAGKAAWWVPKWADRFIPHIDIEGAGLDQDGKSGKGGAAKKSAYDSMKL